MNPFFKAYCRAFQTCFKLALPILPYRSPEIIEHISDIPAVMAKDGLKKPLVVTDGVILGLGLLIGLERALREAGCLLSCIPASLRIRRRKTPRRRRKCTTAAGVTAS